MKPIREFDVILFDESIKIYVFVNSQDGSQFWMVFSQLPNCFWLALFRIRKAQSGPCFKDIWESNQCVYEAWTGDAFQTNSFNVAEYRLQITICSNNESSGNTHGQRWPRSRREIESPMWWIFDSLDVPEELDESGANFVSLPLELYWLLHRQWCESSTSRHDRNLAKSHRRVDVFLDGPLWDRSRMCPDCH